MARVPNLTGEDLSVKTLYPEDELYDEYSSEARSRMEEEFQNRLPDADGLIISDTDLDGIGCAAVLQAAYSGKNYPYIQTNHNSTLSPAEVLNILSQYVEDDEFEHIYICDLPPNDFELYTESIIRMASSNMVTVIDHHDVWTDEKVQNLVGNWVSVVLDNGISATEITYREVADKLPNEWSDFAEQVTDHDCHYNQLEISEKLADYADSVSCQTAVDNALIHVDELGNSSVVESTLQESRKTKEKKIELALSRSTMDTYNGYTIVTTYGRCPASQTADRLFDELEADIVLISRPTSKLHVRTTTEIPIAKDIALKFDGGGHDIESGARLDLVGERISWYKHWASMGRDVREEARETAEDVIDSVEG